MDHHPSKFEINTSRGPFTVCYDTLSPHRVISAELHEYEEADLEDDPDLAKLQGTNIEYNEDRVFHALQELIGELDYISHDHDYYSSQIGPPRTIQGKLTPGVVYSESQRKRREGTHVVHCRTSGSVVFDSEKWDEDQAHREVRLRVQRWLSACRVIGGLDGILAKSELQNKLNELGKVVGSQWGTHDQYMAQAARIEKSYTDNPERYRPPVWVGGLIFEEALARLDWYLTGKDAGNPGDANWSYPKHPEDCITNSSDPIYLSDGGYSRIYVKQVEGSDNGESIQLVLGSESRDEVKANWDDQLPYIARIELAMTEWLREAMETT